MIAAIEARRLHHRQPLDLPVPPETPQMSNIMHQRRPGDGQKCLCVILLALLEGLGIGVHKTRNCVHPVQQDFQCRGVRHQTRSSHYDQMSFHIYSKENKKV